MFIIKFEIFVIKLLIVVTFLVALLVTTVSTAIWYFEKNLHSLQNMIASLQQENIVRDKAYEELKLKVDYSYISLCKSKISVLL
jgi:hypothetical protein